ncbi:MAG: hypothetical protein QOE77_3570 [Blastocatellia bacterium]|jgi:hypothetical protein|nr:hypothetical protein [Blastocatellia bacterium]
MIGLDSRKVGSIVYGLFGTVAIIFGSALLLVPTSLLSEAAQSVHLTHILREQGAAIVFIGLMAFWCLFNYERSRTVHYLLMVFLFLDAGIHWFDYFGGRLPLASPLYNTLPFVVFAAIAAFNRKPETISIGN